MYDARWYNERLDVIVDIMNKISIYSYIIYDGLLMVEIYILHLMNFVTWKFFLRVSLY